MTNPGNTAIVSGHTFAVTKPGSCVTIIKSSTVTLTKSAGTTTVAGPTIIMNALTIVTLLNLRNTATIAGYNFNRDKNEKQ